MSQRNSREAKQARRAKRTLSKGRVDAYIDLVDWVQSRSSLTRAAAIRLILAGALRVDSHKIGFTTLANGQRILNQFVSADLRGRIQVIEPDAS